MLSERDVMKCLSATGCYGNVKMTFESGPYSIDRPTINASKFAEQIESAACAERDARIAELERQMDVMEKNTEAQAHASVMREIELTEKVEKLTRELAEARKVLKETGLLLHHFWCDVQMNDYSFDKLNKGIEAIDEAIKEQT